VDFAACGHIPAPLTYQVERSRFDELLLDHARERGAEIRQGCRAVDVSFTPDAAVVSIADEDGRQATTTASYLIDASGQSGFLAKRLALRRPDAALRNVSFYAWYEGVHRPSGARAGDIRIISRRDMIWIWLIPLTAGLTSIGVVLSRAQHAARDTQKPVSDLLESNLASTAAAAEQLRLATRVSEVRTEADFSYEPKTYVGRRWLLAGDAGSFLDPVFSSGVLLALESGLEAAETVHRSLRETDRAHRSLVSFNRRQRKRYRFYRRFARGFYNPAFRDLFFQTSSRWGLVEDIAVVLAGHWQAPWQRRLKLRAFFMMVVLQRWIAIAPRTHSSSRFRRTAGTAQT
jgi:flavin-dependent dehydrogenase